MQPYACAGAKNDARTYAWQNSACSWFDYNRMYSIYCLTTCTSADDLTQAASWAAHSKQHSLMVEAMQVQLSFLLVSSPINICHRAQLLLHIATQQRPALSSCIAHILENAARIGLHINHSIITWVHESRAATMWSVAGRPQPKRAAQRDQVTLWSVHENEQVYGDHLEVYISYSWFNSLLYNIHIL